MASATTPLAAPDPPRQADDAGARHPRALLVGDVCELYLRINGVPVAKGRPRFRRVGNIVHTYTPKATKDWEDDVAWQVRAQLAIFRTEGAHLSLPYRGRVIAELVFHIPKPKSTPKRVRHHLKKPDPDNYAKAVLDAIETAGVVANDSQVTDLTVRKRYADAEHPAGVDVELLVWR